MTQFNELQSLYTLSDKENTDVFKDIKKVFFRNTEANDTPTLHLVGAQPGAGKSMVINEILNQHARHGKANTIALVSADDYRKFHPKYDEIASKHPLDAPLIVNPDTIAWTRKAIEFAVEKRASIILESTLWNKDLVVKTINEFKAANYKIDINLMAVNPNVSRLGTVERYEQQLKDFGDGRAVSAENHNNRFKGLENTVFFLNDNKIYDNIYIYGRRDGDSVMISLNPRSVASVWKREVTKPFSVKEAQELRGKAAAAFNAMEKNIKMGLGPKDRATEFTESVLKPIEAIRRTVGRHRTQRF